MSERAGPAFTSSGPIIAASVQKNEKDSLDYLYEDVTKFLSASRMIGPLRREVQNRAVPIFTSVTVIFMPVSVVTSYFRMNLVDIRDSTWTQRELWYSFGSAAIAIATIVGLGSILYTFLWPANYLHEQQ
ncbi:hypothetical protein AC579_4921 [Pseudocercospora musae]|uniref:Uncharacterized protein n=1 Tax=Pseudocercospora musae TaxID=113226 RepID=A0A139IE84_9PEZI|nr:hypothetical protein AC579_4921 [Pseudocercospora musae]